jgi:RND family efflux transporter MFP subunit
MSQELAPTAPQPSDHAGEPPGHELPRPWPVGARVAIPIAAVLALLLLGLFALGYLPLRRQQGELATEARRSADAPPRVRTASPKPSAPSTSVRLPGTLAPMQQVTVFARATGYLKSWSKDLGDAVAVGDELARIEAPDLDAGLAQAQAALAQARAQVPQAEATAELDHVSLERLKALGPQIQPQQSIDAAQAAYDVAVANVGVAKAQALAAEAALRRSQELVDFERLTAPFAGVVTARYVDVGALITGDGSSQPLFQVSQTDPLRVFVDVPQPQAPGIAVGQDVAVTVREFGTESFPGRVAHVAHALAPGTHTMTIQVDVPNAQRRLLPGMFATAEITVPPVRRLLTIPATALVLGAKGATVALVDSDNRIHFKTVVIDIDTGAEFGVSDGLQPTDRLVLNPGENLHDGVAVEILPEPPPEASTRSEQASDHDRAH